jgi:ectoine hydroxylase-related dioxygenase (phytanoyl-CoA dioxygenase family)
MRVYRVRILDYTAPRPIAEATMAMASGSSKSAAGPEPTAGEPAHVRDFRRDGYAIVRRVFDPSDIADLAAAFDRVRLDGLGYARSFRHGNVFFRVAEDRRLGRVLRYMQWPSYFEPMLDRFRKDPRILSIVEPLVGADLKQIINQLHWKPAGAAMGEFGYHQDIRFRRPRSAYRDPAASYVQTGIAIDPHRRENGAMLAYPGSHRVGELPLGEDRVMDRPLDDEDVRRVGLDPAGVRVLELEPGDVALWHLCTVHGSGPNRSAIDRRFYINGYVKASMCDRGEWTFRGGEPVALGAPVLVHYEDLFVRPEPHYVDD